MRPHSPMRPRQALSVLAGVLLLAVGAAPAVAGPGDDWVEDDLPRAQQIARAQGKYVLVDFTGSDWCGWCQRLDAEVFDEYRFKSTATQRLVLARLDFPRSKFQTPEVKQRNAAARQAYKIRGFPTILLTEPDGSVFARTGYQRGGVDPYLQMLSTLIETRDTQKRMLEQARRLQGPEQAKALDLALVLETRVKGYETPGRDEIVAQILLADPEDASGVVGRYAEEMARKAVGRDEEKKADDPETGEDAGEEQEAGPVRSPFQQRLDEIEETLTKENARDVLRSLKQLEREARPKGSDAASLVELEARCQWVLGNEKRAYAALTRAARRERDYPLEARQLILLRKARLEAGQGLVEDVTESLDAAVALGPETDAATRIQAERAKVLEAARTAAESAERGNRRRP